MSDRLPYEEQLAQQWNDLPLPDENMAWADMKRRLEEDDDDGVIPFWLRGCGLWGLLLVVLVGIGWWLFRQPKNENEKELVVIHQEPGPKKTKNEKKDTIPLVIGKPVEQLNDNKSFTNKRNDSDSLPVNDQIQKNKIITKRDNEILAGNTRKVITKTKTEEPYSRQRVSKTIKKEKQKANKDNVSVTPGSGLRTKGNDPEPVIKKNNPGVIVNDFSKGISVNTKNTDSIHSDLKGSIKKKDPEQIVKDNILKTDSSKQKSISFSAGIAIHQLLPIEGQKLTPYNSQGRRGSLADYIPSVFFRMYKNEKWFLQSEFRYGAPQYTREILYQQESVADTFNTINTITSAKLKKTFYHQLPVSFNYFVLPNLSIGGGFVWNSFKGAVSEQDVVQRTVATGIDTVLSKGVILNNKKADSNFARSYFQALIETQYKWKRFSLGARYSFGLQPYLKFTLPGGTTQNERNRSVQVFLRYELWKSKTNR